MTGNPRGIQFFSMDADAAAPEGVSGSPGRVTAIVLDGINTEFLDQSYVRDQAIEAVKRMQLNESIAILALTPGLKLQNFTRNRERLLDTINGFLPNLPPYPMRQRIQFTLAALKNLAGRMSGTAGRKSIVWITGGFPRVRAYESVIQKTLNQVNEANVAIYPVDARGLMLNGGARNIETMEQFADATGGEPYYNRNDISVATEEAMEDSRSTYVVGFYLGDKDRDHRFHELRVEVDRPGAVLHYRRGYTPPVASSNAP